MSSLKQIIYDYSKHNTVLNDFYHALSRIRIQLSKHLSDENYLKRQFRKVFGYHLDLNNPKTFNEKLQWLKLHDRNPEYQKLVDKYEVRKYVKETIGEEYLVPLIGIYDDPEDIYFNQS